MGIILFSTFKIFPNKNQIYCEVNFIRFLFLPLHIVGTVFTLSLSLWDFRFFCSFM